MTRQAFFILFVSVCVVGLTGTAAVPGPVARHVDGPAAPGEVLVSLNDDAWRSGIPAIERRLGGRVIDVLPELHTVRLRLREDESVAAAIKRLERIAVVVNVEPNLFTRRAAAPNDTFYGGQAAYLELIEAPAAWEYTAGSDSVIVAVLDSGVDTEHPDLAGRIWNNPLENAGNGIDDDENGCIDDVHGCSFVSAATKDAACGEASPGLVTDDNGHGTVVTGIIAAVASNEIGVSGAAPGVTIAAIKTLDCRGGGTAADAARGILYAARIGARIINLSFSAAGESATLASAIREAHDRYGVVTIAASGNEGTSGVTFPARLPEAIAVGASGRLDDPDSRSPFSNRGLEVRSAGLRHRQHRAPGSLWRSLALSQRRAIRRRQRHLLRRAPRISAGGVAYLP